MDMTNSDDTEIGLEGNMQTSANIDSYEANPSYIYALGQIKPRFSSLAIEKEYAQVLGRTPLEGLNDHQALVKVLLEPSNRYLIRHLCWVLYIGGIETYLLTPRDPFDYSVLAQSLRSSPDPADMDVVIGVLGPLAPPEACGLVLPIVTFDQLYSFDRHELLAAIPHPEGQTDENSERFSASASELLDRILQIADNLGAANEHRALNYLAMRYPAIYHQTLSAHLENYALESVNVFESRLRGVRDILDIVFSFRHRVTDVSDKYFVRVDVTEEYPFLVSKLSSYYSR